MRVFIASTCIALLIAAAPAPAASVCTETSENCTQVGVWTIGLGVGYGRRSNPVASASDINLIVIPELSYYGRRVFLDNLDAGVLLYEGSLITLNLLATPGYDSVFFDKRDPQNFFITDAAGIAGPVLATSSAPGGTQSSTTSAAPVSSEQILERERKMTYLVGPEWQLNYGDIVGQLTLLYEATGRHHGSEARAAIAAPVWRTYGTLTAAAGATWKSHELVTYYYGEPGLYDASAALNPFVKLSYSLPLAKRWSLNAVAHHEWLDSSITHSPIVNDSTVLTWFAGIAYSLSF
jgi:outer membrane protein